MKKTLAMLVPAVFVLFGCASPTPIAQNFPMSFQKVARTAHHWDVVAEDVAASTMQAISEKPQLQGRGIFVSPVGNSAFSGAFRDFLVTKFVNHGESVSVCKINTDAKGGFAPGAPDIEVQYETKVIRHGGHMPDYHPGEFTALAAGVTVLHNAGWVLTKGQGSVAILGGGLLADWINGNVASTTRTELIVTTTIAEGNRFVMRRSDIYYVPDADARLFIQQVAQRSPCQSEKRQTVANITDDYDDQLARQDLINRGMRRFNPEYRSTQTAYSY